ncbi:transposase [Candidatus Roizmanbacteria bacterium]|nr:transposase [Candidatus Roizmanbacteria bacterium]
MRKTIRSILSFNNSQVAQRRLQIIEFHIKYGTRATIDAFLVSKPTIYRWKKTLKDRSGELDSLIPSSRSPRRRRVMVTHFKIIEFIKSIREQYGHLGKEKIKPLLDEYCLRENIKSIAESTIGKVIKRHNLYPKSRRIYHNPTHSHAKARLSYKLKVKKSPKPQGAGYIEIDTIVKFIHGIKLYILNAVDVNLKFQFSYGYTRLNSQNSLDFMRKLELVYPLENGIHTVQTDNGLEFMGDFDDYLKRRSLKHLFIYPRCPKINGFVERANRTLQEEFINGHEEYAHDGIVEFNSRLMDYLVWYNTKRVHKSLGNVSPINHLLRNLPPKSQMYVTYTLFCKINAEWYT